MPIHIRAEAGAVAPAAILVGDPLRAARAAAMLDSPTIYNERRGLLGVTGSWRGHRLTVQTTGMGGPTAAIVTEELAALGVRTVIRAGTCGAVADRVNVLDFCIATASVPLCGTTRQYVENEPFAPVADFAVTRALVDAAAAGDPAVHTGLFVSEDAFYQQGDRWERWRARGVIAVEMEAAAIFTVALARGLAAGCICLAVDRVGAHETWAGDEAIANGETALLRMAFDSVLALENMGA